MEHWRPGNPGKLKGGTVGKVNQSPVAAWQEARVDKGKKKAGGD